MTDETSTETVEETTENPPTGGFFDSEADKTDDGEAVADRAAQPVEIVHRAFSIDASPIDEAERRVQIAVSSEAPVERQFGIEVLKHTRDAINLDFFDGGRAPLLLDHDPRQVIGIVENTDIDEGAGRLRATVRFSKSALGEEVFRDVLDGIRSNVSVGYRIENMVSDENDEGAGVTRFVVDSWTPVETSIVSIPADTSVGVGRSAPVPNIHKDEAKAMTEAVIDEGAVRAAAADEARADERKRVREISALAGRHQLKDIGDKAIDDGTGIDEFRAQVLNAIGDAKPLYTPADQPDISEKEQRDFSLVRAIRAAANNDWSDAGYEREVSSEIARNTGRDPKGFYVPAEGWGQRNIIVGTNADGGFMKGTDHLGNEFIAALRGRLEVAGLGARIMTGLQGDVAIPKISAGGSAGFVGEGSAVSEVNQTFAQVTLAPKTLGTFTDLSRKLVYQSDPSAEAVIRDDLMAAVAAKIEDVSIEGDGSNEPTGVTKTSGIGSIAIGTNGGAPTFASVTGLVKEVEADNAALTDNQGFITNPKVKHKLASTAKVSSSDSVMILDDPWDTLYGYPIRFTTHVPSDLTKGSTSGTCSAMIFGDWSQLMIGFWSGMDVLVDPYTGGPAGNIRILVHQDLDVAVRHAQSFAACLDYTTT